MEAYFTFRKTRAADLPDCLKLHPAKNGAENLDPARALQAWRQLLAMTYATRSAVIEKHANGKPEGNGNGKPEVVGFGFASFVKKSFAEAEVANPRPGLNGRILQSILDGDPVIASYQEVRDANTTGTLEQVILDASWKHGFLSPSQVADVRVALGESYQDLFSGYCFSRILTEIVDELDAWHMQAFRTFQVVDRFDAYRAAHPGTVHPDRLLAAATIESMSVDPYSVASGLFQHRRLPQLGFTQGEQELLEAALEGMDDAVAAEFISVSLPAIKRRWATIFQRVAAIRPDICPPDGDGTRGIQKRQRILTYVRNHPEELRPFDPAKRVAAQVP